MPTLTVALLSLQVAFAPGATGNERRGVEADADTVSVWREDVEVGRFWHATRLLRALGPNDALLPGDQVALARAEAGWSNWRDVITLLTDQEWLAGEAGGEGLFLLGRAHEEMGDSLAAVDHYAAFETVAALGHADLPVARVRRIRILGGLGRTDEVMTELRALSGASYGLSSWLALDLARAAAAADNVELTERLLSEVVAPDAASAKWELLPELRLARGDTASALSALAGALSVLDSPAVRADVWARRGALLLASGDSTAARDAFLNTLEAGPDVTAGSSAASGILDLGVEDPGLALDVARWLRRGRRYDEALTAYALHDSLLGDGREPQPDVQLEAAALLVREKRYAEAGPTLDDLSRSHDERIGPAALALRVDVLKATRRRGEAEALEAQIVRRFPESVEAAEVVFFQADEAHDAGRLEDAAARYQQAATMAPASERAGLAWMRLGHIRVTQGNLHDAVRVFNAYLDAQPRGQYAAEAAYWSAWASLKLGDRDEALPRLEAVRRNDPLSYYAVQTARLLDEPYEIHLADTRPPIMPPWLRGGLRHLELLVRSGLRESETAFQNQLIDRARVNDDILLLLAREMTEILPNPWEAIRLGWEVRRRGRPWDRLLLEVIYPFPYRDIVVREAEEWGVSPYLVAGLIRQESAFFAQARSSANARGLMQVLPVTGSQMARQVGPERFGSATLYEPDVNLHLGTAYLRDMLARYDEDLPLVLSAYNAGPARATRWKRFPEAGDAVRFTERIPFRETRGYVKNVTRNMEVYRFLYGDLD